MNTKYVTLTRSSYRPRGSNTRFQRLITWDVSETPTGRFLKEKDVPTQEVRTFCRKNDIAFLTEDFGFWGTTIYARDIGGQMFFKLKYDVTIPLEHEWRAMIAAQEAFVKQMIAASEAERQSKRIKEVVVNADQRSITVTLNNGHKLHTIVSQEGSHLVPYRTVFEQIQEQADSV